MEIKKGTAIQNFLTEIKIRMDRGNVLLGWIRNIVLIVASLKYIITLNILTSFIIAIGLFILFYIIGKIDLDYLKIFQLEQELLSSKYNSHLDKVKNIKGVKTDNV